MDLERGSRLGGGEGQGHRQEGRGVSALVLGWGPRRREDAMAIGRIVDGVEYLHNYCQPLVIHCDLKPSNILLAEDMSARVGDFGISRILKENTSEGMQTSYSSTGIRGSIGYVAPGD